MSGLFKGITFPWQEVTPSDDAIVRKAMLPDRRLSGCELSYSGYTLTMTAGVMIVCGRQFRHTAAQNWAVTGAASGYARLLLTIDTTKASTEDAFEQISVSVEYATASDGFPELRQDDINSAGTIYQTSLCVIALGPGGITGIADQIIPGDNVFHPGRLVSMDGHRVTDVADPVENGDAMNLEYANKKMVTKAMLKTLAYSQTNADGNTSVATLTEYPKNPGVFRVGVPIAGLPANVGGYGTLVIFDAGGYILHLYMDMSGVLSTARTADGVTTPTGWKVAGGCALTWKNASPGSSFGAQTWTSNISAWSVVLIKFAFHATLTSDEFAWWEVCPIGAAGSASFTSLGGTGHPVSVHRAFATSVNGVSFGKGSYHQGTAYVEEDDTRAIPLEIYVM